MVTGILIGGYLLLLLLLNFSPFQRSLAGWTERLLAEKLKTEVCVGSVEVGLFNRVTLHDVAIRDQWGSSLLEAGLLSVKIEFLPLLDGQLTLRSVSLLDAKVNLYKPRRDGPTNFQFVADAFRSDDPSPQRRHWDVHVNSLILRRCAVSYEERFRPRKPGRLDLAHLRVGDIDANISLREIDRDSLNLRVRSFNMREQCGFEIRSLSFRMAANRQHCDIARFELALPGTRLEEETFHADYNADSAKDFLETLAFTGRMRVRSFATDDIVGLLPVLKPYGQTVSSSFAFEKRGNSLRVKDFELTEQGGLYRLRGDARFVLDDGRLAACRARLADAEVADTSALRLVRQLTQMNIPTSLTSLFPLRFKGMVNYVRAGRTQATVELTTAVGQLYASLHGLGKSYTAQVSSSGIALTPLFAGRHLPAEAAFHLDAMADLTDRQSPVVEAGLLVDSLRYLERGYGQIQARLRWADRRFTAHVESADENLHLRAQASGLFDGKKFQAARVEARFDDISPAILGLTDRYGLSRFSSTVRADFTDLRSGHWDGTLAVSDFSMMSESREEVYSLDSLHLRLRPSALGTRLTLHSDFARVDMDGKLSVRALKQCGRDVVERLWHSGQDFLAHGGGSPGGGRADGAQWRFYVELYRTDFLQKLLDVPLTTDGPLTLQGNLRGDGGRVSVTASTRGIEYGGFALRDLRFYLNGQGGDMACLAQGVKQVGAADMRVALESRVAAGRLQSQIRWDDVQTHRYSGTLRTLTTVTGRRGEEQVTTRIIPTTIAVADTTWSVRSGRFVWAGKRLSVDSFLLSHADQSLSVDGRVSPDPSDSIVARLRKMDISYILSLANLKPVSFSGQATGSVTMSMREGNNLGVTAQLDIPQFFFNEGLMGRTHIRGDINLADGRLNLDADMREDSIDGRTQVKGFVGIKEKGLDLHVTSRKTNLHFLRRYVSEILGDVAGRTTGTCRIFGPFKELDFEGEERATMSAEVLATGVAYKLDNGIVEITPGEFRFKDFDVSDGDGGSGTFEGSMRHTHIKNVRYDFDVSAERLHVYDKGRSVDLPFYANVYGSGRVKLQGFPGTLTADINLRPDRGTFLTYIVNTPETFSESGLLELRPAAPDSLPGAETAGLADVASKVLSDTLLHEQEEAVSNNIYLNFIIDMNPAATLRVITDEKAGDHLLLSGNGPIRATFYNKGGFQMFGTFTVGYGTYRMSIQNVIRKNFTFRQGGTINFSGDPYNGDLDLQAVYTVPSASLADLGLGANFSDNAVRADCILQLTGKVKAPRVSFDLDLPDVSEDVAQMVRQLISTEEDMNMQIIYLLGVGRFYTYNFSSTEAAAGGQSQSSVAMKSFLSSTLSSQLNDLIAGAMGYSNWSFGTNLSTGQIGWSDMEVAGLLSGHLLNNRLLINGNFGYRDRPTSTTNFVGDFDIQYLLTPSGSVSLKAYSETNDRYFTKSALTTQGIGIRLSRDFTNLRDLFQVRKRRKPQPRFPELPAMQK